MTRPDIDDALGGEEPIEPSPEFRARVMRAVHARAGAGPYAGVERALWPGVAVASIIVALLVAVMWLERADTRTEETADVVRWLIFSLTGTFALAWRNGRRII